MKLKITLNSVLIVCLLFLITPSIFAQNDSAPWKSLFNGKNLDGWKIVGSKGIAYVQDGEIICHRTPDTREHTFVTSNKKYSDFILEIDFKLDPPGFSSGVLIRCIDAKADPDTTKVRLYGYQVKIDDRKDRRWTGGIFDDFGGTWKWMYDLTDNVKAQEAFKMGEWNTFHIEAIGNNMKVWINNVPATNLVNNKYKNGYIALKIHGAKANQKGLELKQYFRNIRIIDKNPKRYVWPMDLTPKTVN